MSNGIGRGELERIRKIVTSIAEKNDVDALFLFGSRARGDNREDSDYDILVYAEDMGLLEMSRLLADLTDVLGTEVDISFGNGLKEKDRSIPELERDMVLLYDRWNGTKEYLLPKAAIVSCGAERTWALEDMLEFCDNISDAVARFGGKDEFLDDCSLQSSCSFSLMRIGDKARRIPTPMKEKHPEVDWKQIAEFKNVTTLHMDGMFDIIWKMVETIPSIRSHCVDMLDDIRSKKKI